MTATLPSVDASPTAPAPRRSAPRPRPAWRMRLSTADQKGAPYLYIAPFFLIFAVFGLIPLLFTFVVSLFDWNPIGQQTFIGFDNFTRLAADPRFWNAMLNTFAIFIISTVPQLVIALGLAHLLNHVRLRFATGFRMAMLVPYITSVAATTIVFAQLFDRDYGLFNYLISFFGGDHVDFLNVTSTMKIYGTPAKQLCTWLQGHWAMMLSQ